MCFWGWQRKIETRPIFLNLNSWKSHFLIARTHSKKGSIQPPVFSHLQNVRYECCISIKVMPYIFFQPPSDYMGKMTQRRFIKNVESQKKGRSNQKGSFSETQICSYCEFTKTNRSCVNKETKISTNEWHPRSNWYINNQKPKTKKPCEAIFWVFHEDAHETKHE